MKNISWIGDKIDRQLIPIITGHNLFLSYDLLFKFTEGHIFILTDIEMHTTFKTITNLF